MRAKACKVLFGLIAIYMLYLLNPVLVGNAVSGIFWEIINIINII